MINNGDLLTQIGHTPLVLPKSFWNFLGIDANIYCKCEGLNPAGSIKDRAALEMIDQAEVDGLITKDTIIIEATSGNTGIGLALVCAQRGYQLMLTMPESMSLERRNLLQAMGAQLVLTDEALGMQGSVDKARELATAYPSSYLPDQFSNPANAAAHYQTTAPEIWQDLAGQVDVLIATIGTGGTISGCAQFLKEKNQDIIIIGVEPDESPLLSKGHAGPHIIQGIGANFVPQILDKKIIDEILPIKGEDALDFARSFGKSEGNLVGISSGAAIAAAVAVATRPNFGSKNIVAILPDRGERYMSTPLFDF